MVLVTQATFKEDFKDYNKKVLKGWRGDFQMVTSGITGVVGKGFDETVDYFEENDISDKAKKLYKEAKAYASEDEDINMIHNQFTDICEEMLNISTMVEVASQNEKDIMVEYYTAIDMLATKIEIYQEMYSDLCAKYEIDEDELLYD